MLFLQIDIIYMLQRYVVRADDFMGPLDVECSRYDGALAWATRALILRKLKGLEDIVCECRQSTSRKKKTRRVDQVAFLLSFRM